MPICLQQNRELEVMNMWRIVIILILAEAASASVSLELQLFYNGALENILTQSGSSKLHLCLQPAHTSPQSSHCPYGEFIVSDVTSRAKRNGFETFHFLNFWPKDGFQLLIQMISESPESTDKVTIPFPKTLSFMDGIQEFKTGNTQFSLSYKILSTCKPGSYGEQCSSKCTPPPDATDGCDSICNYLGEVVCPHKDSTQRMQVSEGVVYREKRQQPTDSGGLDRSTVIIVSVVTVVGGYLILLATFILILVLCFVRCDKKTCTPKITRKPCSSDAAQLCCERCVDACCDDDYNISFWFTIIVLVILCFPFGLCFIVLYALGSSN